VVVSHEYVVKVASHDVENEMTPTARAGVERTRLAEAVGDTSRLATVFPFGLMACASGGRRMPSDSGHSGTPGGGTVGGGADAPDDSTGGAVGNSVGTSGAVSNGTGGGAPDVAPPTDAVATADVDGLSASAPSGG
jgi:hypothetical protein